MQKPCYDKYHRCPGWAGSGWSLAPVQSCNNGYVRVDYNARFWKLRPWRCDDCRTWVQPWAFRWFDPSWWQYVLFDRPTPWHERLGWRRRAVCKHGWLTGPGPGACTICTRERNR